MASEYPAPQAGLIIEVLGAEPLVRPWRRRFDPAADGVPAHITVLFPFVAPADITPEVLDRVREVARTIEPFEYELVEFGQFPGVLWLRPEPEKPFRELTERLVEAFPDHPPYGDPDLDPLPHLTLGFFDEDEMPAALEEAERDLAARLPWKCKARMLSIFVNHPRLGPSGWRCRQVIPLGEPGPPERD